jgi:acyl carrier protein
MSYFVVPEQVENLNETIPVGRGIQDVQLLILNESHRCAGIGEVGEIYVRTPHLTKGYIGDDALTNKRYLVNPFTHLPIDRLYKTGDRGRYLPDGNVEFLGRADDQVKIRGYRVEIAEIQVLLQHHPAIKDAAVLVLEEEAGDSRLVAYVVPDGHEAMDVSELRTYVKQRLPDYMVPSSFIPLDALPLTPNGKVDRRALPKPDGARPDVGISYVAPQTELEQTLAKIWQQVLHLDRVGAQDNFFDLGGHSLLLVEVQNKAQEALERDVSLIDLFQYPTISSLAKYLSQQHAEGPTFQDVQDRVRNRREVRSRRKQLYEKELKTHE